MPTDISLTLVENPLSYFCTFVRISWASSCGHIHLFSVFFHSSVCSCPFLCQHDHCSYMVRLEIRLILSKLVFFFKIVLSYSRVFVSILESSFLYVQINPYEILIAIALYLYISLGSTDIFPMQSLLVHGHRVSLYVICPQISFIGIL